MTNLEMSLFVGSVQFKGALVITGVMKETSLDKTYKELGLESLKSRR